MMDMERDRLRAGNQKFSVCRVATESMEDLYVKYNKARSLSPNMA